MKSTELYRIQTEVAATYDQVAAEYVKHLSDELDHKPFDRKMLEWLKERVASGGMICDLGCGPGQIARYLFERGASVCGIDLSPNMIQQARELSPQIEFRQGDMLALSETSDASFAGIAAFYAIVNVPGALLPRVFSEMFRILGPDGQLLLAFHVGTETRHLDEWWDHKVAIDFFFFETARIKEDLVRAGFALSEVIEREPYPDVEYPSRRAYIFARKPPA
jgi:ubiquinone/menaquinone biosynthesis C-methylase UbiE